MTPNKPFEEDLRKLSAVAHVERYARDGGGGFKPDTQ